MANILDKITETYNGQNPTSTTVSGSRAIGGTTLTCTSLTGWPTATAVHFATYQKDSNGVKKAGTQTDWKGIVSGSSINTLTRQGGAADGGNSVGDIVEMMPTNSWANDLAKGLENTLNQDGTLKTGLNPSFNNVTVTGNETVTGTLGITGVLTPTGGLSDTSILPTNLVASSGTSWAWQSWTPSLVNLSGGTITTAKYTQIGKTVHFLFIYTLAGANISGNVTFSLPVTPSSDFNSNITPIGQATYENSGVATYMGYIDIVSSSLLATLFVHNAAGTYLTADTTLSSTVPHTWKSGDHIRATGTYEAA